MRGSRWFLAGQAASLGGDGLAVLAVPLLVLQLTGSPVMAALASAPRTVGYLIAGLPAGPLVDRADPWRVLIAADIVRLVVFLVLSCTVMIRACPVGLILGLACVAGVAGVFFETALAVAVRDVYADHDLLRANSFLETCGQMSVVMGPAAVGFLAAGVGIGPALLVDAATFAISLVTLRRILRRMPRTGTAFATARLSPGPPALRAIGAEFRAGLRYMRSSALVAGIAVLQAVTTFALAVETLIPYFARNELHASTALVGVSMAGGGIGGTLGALGASMIAARCRPVPLCLAGVLTLTAALAFLGVAPNILWFTAAHAVLMGASMLVVVVVRTLRQRVVPRAMLGRVTSTVRSMVLAAGAAGTVLAGLLTQLDGNNPRPVFLGAAGFIALSTPLVRLVVLGRHSHVSMTPVGAHPDPRTEVGIP